MLERECFQGLKFNGLMCSWFGFSTFCHAHACLGATVSAYVPPAQVPKTFWPHKEATADNGRFWPRPLLAQKKKKEKKKKEKERKRKKKESRKRKEKRKKDEKGKTKKKTTWKKETKKETRKEKRQKTHRKTKEKQTVGIKEGFGAHVFLFHKHTVPHLSKSTCELQRHAQIKKRRSVCQFHSLSVFF